MDATAWDRLKASIPIGTEVTGRIVACQPFGVFVDLGLGFHGLLELPEFSDPSIRKRGMSSFPSVGESITARVLQYMERNKQLRLTQHNGTEEQWAKIRAEQESWNGVIPEIQAEQGR
jgi:ribosomal protein S1